MCMLPLYLDILLTRSECISKVVGWVLEKQLGLAQYGTWASRLGEYDRADPIIHHLGDYNNMTQCATTKSL